MISEGTLSKVYLAAPLFCRSEIGFNLALTERLEKAGFSVFLPQRDGPDAGAFSGDAAGLASLRRTVFETDRDEVLRSDILIFVLDGRVPDEGACFELGVAYAQRLLEGREKLLVGLSTDRRGAFLGSQYNPMLAGAFDRVVTNQEELLSVVTDFAGRG